MRLYGFIRTIRAFLYLVFFYLLGILLILAWTLRRILTEIRFRKEYGKDWVQEFEKYNGSLVHANIQISIGISSLIAISLVAIWFYRQQSGNNSSKKRRKNRR